MADGSYLISFGTTRQISKWNSYLNQNRFRVTD